MKIPFAKHTKDFPRHFVEDVRQVLSTSPCRFRFLLTNMGVIILHVKFFTEISTKIKQVRRIQSLMCMLKSTSIDSANNELMSLWQSICRATGYGNRWDHWLLSFEPIAFVPSYVPSYDQLDVFLQITVTDCNMTCNQENHHRKQLFDHKIKLDVQDNFSKCSYSYIHETAFCVHLR